MHANLDILLSDRALAALSDEAAAVGKTPAELAATIVERMYGGDRPAPSDPAAARAQFEACFGSVDLGQPIGIANDAIDIDLAREYGARS